MRTVKKSNPEAFARTYAETRDLGAAAKAGRVSRARAMDLLRDPLVARQIAFAEAERVRTMEVSAPNVLGQLLDLLAEARTPVPARTMSVDGRPADGQKWRSPSVARAAIRDLGDHLGLWDQAVKDDREPLSPAQEEEVVRLALERLEATASLTERAKEDTNTTRAALEGVVVAPTRQDAATRRR